MDVKSTGIIRRFDYFGRIVIPKEFRKKLNNGKSDMSGIQMDICMDGDMIVLRKCEDKYEEKNMMKKFKCTVTKETTMDIEIDDTIWTPEAIQEWQRSFCDTDDLEDVVKHIASMKSEYEDGSFIEGFGIPMINGKKPYSYIKDNEVAKDINICEQNSYTDVEVEEI